MNCSDMEKVQKAKSNILNAIPDAKIEIMQLDLSKMQSVKQFAENYLQTVCRFCGKHEEIKLLIKNTSVILQPYEKLPTK